MKSLPHWAGVALLCAAASLPAEERVVEHFDPLIFDKTLSLAQTVEATFQKYPQTALVAAFEDEARALERRGSSWIAGYPMLYLQWIDDRMIDRRGQTEIQTGYQLPFWMWNQRKAGQQVAEEARRSAERFTQALKLEVAGLVRDVLWNVLLVENRHGLAKQTYEVAERLVQIVKRRVELGDLARADLLLAESDRLEKKTALVQAEAEVMHARKAYTNLTRLERAPAGLEETRSPRLDLDESHPAVAAANALVERAQAEVEYTRLSKQGNQPSLLIGTNHARGERSGIFNNAANLVLQVPIGGDDYNAPFVAEANVALNTRIAEREQLLRQLEKALHEAHHNLEVDEATLEIAEQRKELAESQLRMSKIAFETGEISLIDYLKIQSGAQAAIRDAAERAIQLRKDTAMYNQVVGVMP